MMKLPLIGDCLTQKSCSFRKPKRGEVQKKRRIGEVKIKNKLSSEGARQKKSIKTDYFNLRNSSNKVCWKQGKLREKN